MKAIKRWQGRHVGPKFIVEFRGMNRHDRRNAQRIARMSPRRSWSTKPKHIQIVREKERSAILADSRVKGTV